MRIGDIAFSLNKHSVYSKLVMIFTGGAWSHCFFLSDGFEGELVAIESDLKVQVVPVAQYFEPDAPDVFELWRPIGVDPMVLQAATYKAFRKYAGQTYGFAQLFWFVWRWLCGKFGYTPRKNWFPGGVICSEFLLYYLLEIGGSHAEAFKHLTFDECDPEQLYLIVRRRRDLFERAL
jgi:hypothetical protein